MNILESLGIVLGNPYMALSAALASGDGYGRRAWPGNETSVSVT